jgi:hypothetical protein
VRNAGAIGVALALGLSLSRVAAADTSSSGAHSNEHESTRSKVADPEPDTLGAFAEIGYLGSPGAHGSAFGAGLRLRLADHLAASADLGYGLLSDGSTVQDRWWVIPSLALVLPVRALRFDLGAGAGVGTASGYTSWSGYTSAPFTPTWHATVPAVRGHAIATFPLTQRLDLVARGEVATLVFTGLDSAHSGPTDTSWVALSLGVQYGMN